MLEASKTTRFQGREYIEKYFSGAVLDIGCGPDLVVPHAQPFDLQHGDANQIAKYLPPESFDCVHSSHCLEHMRNASDALRQWWSLVRPGGTLIVAVPEENLYEQGVWPPMFNTDHKATFRWGTSGSWSPVSVDLKELAASLPGAEIVEGGIQDAGYDYRLKSSGSGVLRRPIRFLRNWRERVFRRLGLSSAPIGRFLAPAERLLGCPVDQTGWNALAQIQVIVRKKKSAPAELSQAAEGRQTLHTHSLHLAGLK